MPSDKTLNSLAVDVAEVGKKVDNVERRLNSMAVDAAELGKKVDNVERGLNTLAVEVGKKFDNVDRRLNSMAVDAAELGKKVDNVERRLDHHDELFEQMIKGLAEVHTIIRRVEVTSSSLASSVGLAMTELAYSRTLERRVERLEAAVFPPKH